MESLIFLFWIITILFSFIVFIGWINILILHNVFNYDYECKSFLQQLTAWTVCFWIALIFSHV